MDQRSTRPPRPLERRFFARASLTVARELIGCVLVHEAGRRRASGRIVETEAYIGESDGACHARFGLTKRSEVLYGAPGFAYVYLIYGMYDLLNVVTEREGFPAAVLIRAIEADSPLDPGAGAGPGRLTRALRIDRRHNRRDLTQGALRIEKRREHRRPAVETSPRIGIDYAGAWASKPWRFFDPGSPAVSRRRSAGAQK